MSFLEHLEAMRKDMQAMTTQMQQNKGDIEKTRNEMSHLQLQMQEQQNPQMAQIELVKFQEQAKKLEQIARTYVTALTDSSLQVQLVNELDQISKSGSASAAPASMPISMAQPMSMNAAIGMQPHMMMRNPMLQAMGAASPRVSKGNGSNGGMPNGGINGMHAMMQMQQQMQMAQQMQVSAFMAQAQMFNGVPMMGIPGMGMHGMPPGMAGLPGMMQSSNAAAAAAMQQLSHQQMAAAIAVSTPSRNQSTSGAASRTRTPLTASATNSPRPAEPIIKEEEITPADPDVQAAAIAPSQVVVSEDNSTVAVA